MGRRHPLILALAAAVLVTSTPLLAGPYVFSYGGRLANSSDVAVVGPVSLEIKFYRVASGGNAIGVSSLVFNNVPLEDGVFQIDLNQLTAAEMALVFDSTQDTYVEVTDRTNSVTYPRQHLSAMPYAMKVPVDGKTLAFDSNGNLGLATAGAPGANQFLTKDSSGNLVWGTPAASASALQGRSVSTTTPSAGQVLSYDGTNWTAATLASGTGSVTSITGSSPIIIGGTSTAPVISIAAAGSGSGGYLTSTDYTTFSNKLSKSGGTMTGALNMGGSALTGLATPTASSDAATKAYVDSGTSGVLNSSGSVSLTGAWTVGNDLISVGHIKLNAQKTLLLGTFNNSQETSLVGGLITADRGKIWLNSQTSQIKFWDGSAAQTLAASGASGFLTVSGDGTNGGKLVLNEKGTGGSVALKAPDTLFSSVTWTLPSSDGSAGYVLSTNGSGSLSWAASGGGGTGGGISSLNGLTGASQTLVTNASGTAFSFTASGSAHTLNIPMASTGSVAAGLISNSDYATFSAKQGPGSYITGLSGDLSASGAGIAAATLTPTGVTSGTYTKVSVDNKGRVSSGTSLMPTDIPVILASQVSGGTLAGVSAIVSTGSIKTGNISPLLLSDNSGATIGLKAPVSISSYTLTLPTVNGSAGNTLMNDGSGNLSWTTPTDPTKLSKFGDTMTGNLILPGSNIGIGTTAPTNALTVYANTQDAVGIVGNSSTGVSLNLTNTAASSSWSLYASGSTGSGPMSGVPSGSFVIYSNPNSSSRLAIGASGNVGIGTTSPMGLFDVANGGTHYLVVQPGSGNVGVGTPTPGANFEVMAGVASVPIARFINTNNTNNAMGLMIQAGSASGSGAALIAFNSGSGTAIGAVVQTSGSGISYNTTSDRRLKEHIIDSQSGLELLELLKVHDYNYIADPSKQTLQGFIAQELYEVYPQAVTVGGDDPKVNPWQVDYSKLTPLLVKSVQDLKQQLDEKDAEITKLKTDAVKFKDALCALRDIPLCHE